MSQDKSMFLDYLRQIYDQANEHLREQEHKRDQVITFYAVLLSFFITANKAIAENFDGPLIILFLSLGLFLIGIVVCLTIASLRGWHSQYLDAIYVLNYVIAHEESYETVLDLKNALQSKIVENQNKPELFILFVAVKTLCKVTLVCKKSSFLLVLLSDCLKKDRLHPFPKKNIFYFVSSQRIYF